MQRDYMRDDQRRRDRADDDPRDDPRERYGNEEDQYSRESRRAYADQNLPARLRDDSPYDQPGYEPEAGRPGGRENVDMQRPSARNDRPGPGYGNNRPEDGNDRTIPSHGNDWSQRNPEAAGGRGQYQDRPASQSQQRGRETYDAQRRPDSHRRPDSQRDPYGQSAYRQLASPYEDDNAIGPWYGGNTGMGDAGSSQGGNQGQSQPAGSGEAGRMGDARQRGGAGFQSRGGASQHDGGYRSDDRFTGRPSSQFDDGQRSRSDSGQQVGGQRDWQQPDQHDPLHGPFSGRGPRNYQRSDERIRDDVCELLTRHGGIDASQMDVDVRQGVVTLRGSVDSGRIRRMTEELVEDIAGVRDVQNDLRVNQRTGYVGTTGPGAQSASQGTSTGAGMGDSSALVGQSFGGSGARQGDTASAASTGGATSGEQHSTPAYGMGVASTSGVSTRSGPGEPGVGAGAGRSQQGNPWQVHETMDVVGSDGESVGTVKLVAGTDFVLNRPMARDLHVPFSAVKTVDGDRVLLTCRTDEVDQQNWPTSDLAGSGSSASTTTGRADRPTAR